jgi:hypothetical protein
MEDKYYWIDKKAILPTLGQIWTLYKSSLDAPTEKWLGAPFRLLRGPIYTLWQSWIARVALNSPTFDYGAETSLRHYASDDSYHLFFQRIDERMYFQTVEKQILETICNFLEAHRIDTTEFRERQQMILNNGTINAITTTTTLNNSTIGSFSGGQIRSNSPQPSPR